jgi:peptidoglycan/LPS O-acetylase OafA/YrhL
MQTKKIYLPRLNGIRAIAVIAVVASHINHRSIGFGLPMKPLLDLAGFINHEIVATITIILIFNQIYNPKSIINLENSFFDFLGNISFGLSIYNPLVIFLMQKLLNNLPISNIIKIVLVYGSVFFVLILISYLSFIYYENYFLKFKKNFIQINSFSNHKSFKSAS